MVRRLYAAARRAEGAGAPNAPRLYRLSAALSHEGEHARRRQIVLRPLFPRYLFAGIDRATMPWRPILSTVGVTDVVRAGDEPAAVPAEIAAIRERETTGALDRLDSRQLLRLGELVCVTTGAFEDMVGRLVELRDQDRIVVLLELLGRAVRAQLRADVVEPA
jgi:transcriptional antiterminator RfaH